MRASRTYGSVRGARHETRVPTATEAARVHCGACRRGYVADCGGCAAGPSGPKIGILASGSKSNPDMARRLSAFSQGLRELGWIDGRSVRIDARGADGDANRLRASSAELVGKTPDVIFASGNTALRALQQATQTIPIVFAQVPDPICRRLRYQPRPSKRQYHRLREL